MGVVDNWREHLAALVLLVGLFDEALFAFEVAAVGFDAKGLTQDAQYRVVGVERAVDDGRQQTLGVVQAQGLLEHALARTGLADDDT